ncbi:acyl-CoA desaturase [Streptomyces sp. S07_1.15]|uniref:fatty acid desaturase family protein n=1 Tax=Streptomyces sp. S07_1.15 TaxID=2873925 RepID=UPI001D14E0A5|nr:acyl-CoA desaturase [Streptomyces sp. S07_1.15]MCC3650957.1 acyl-CoA desaturase [Streptomyces sp. S07_1.15]
MTTSTEAPGTARAASETVHPPRTAESGSDFARLAKRISRAGLLERRPRYYAVRFSVVSVLFAAGWTAFALLGDSWWQPAVAAFLGLVFGQIALLTHDLAHRQVFRRRRPSETGGRLFGNLGIGMSYGWWMNKHTRHHANPNHEELDPDVTPDILVWSGEQARKSRGLPRFIGRRQAYLFFPLLTLEGFNLHVSSVRALFAGGMKRRILEAVLLSAHTAVYLGALFLVLSPGKALLFLFVHQAVFGVYLGSTFAPNHKGMPTFTGGDRPDFLRRQVLTSRNVRGGHLMDIALGGLNYQIEHHLFPSMATPHLRRARAIVREYCAELNIPYHETGLIASYREALRHLHAVGAPLRRGGRDAVPAA